MRRAPLALVLAALALGTVPALPGSPAEPQPQQVLTLHCDRPDAIRMMELTYAGTCWMHGGHHTYFVGRDTTYRFRGLTGMAFSVEQQFSVPTEDPALVTATYRPDVGLGPVVDTPSPTVTTPLPVELSLDGVTWTRAGVGHYGFLPSSFVVANALCPATGERCPTFEGLIRRNVHFELDGQGQEFRFLRVRQPMSQATQGLSGFLDFTGLEVRVDPGTPLPEPSFVERQRDLPCERAMEAIFADHPCWFGGLDRWDAPSFFHTWFLGPVQLERVRATFTVLPWRTDDFFAPGVSADDLLVRVTAQVSEDSVWWTNLTTVRLPYGQGTLEVDGLGGVPAQFLRLVPEKHARFDQHQQFAPNHHPRGYFVDSAAHIEGLMAQ